jgi:hypothetical protein
MELLLTGFTVYKVLVIKKVPNILHCVWFVCSAEQQHVDGDDEGGGALRHQVSLRLHEWTAPHL